MWHLQNLWYFLWIRDINFRFLPWSFSSAYPFLLPIDISNFYKLMLLFDLTTYDNIFSPYCTNVIYVLHQCTLSCLRTFPSNWWCNYTRTFACWHELKYLWKSSFIAWITLMFSITNFLMLNTCIHKCTVKKSANVNLCHTLFC